MLGVVAVLVVLALAATSFLPKRIVMLTGGKRYRFFFRLAPAISAADVIGMRAGLSASGATDIDVNSTPNETVGTYVMTALTSKELNLSQPILQSQGVSVFLTKVEEL